MDQRRPDSFFPSFELRPSERHELLASWRARRRVLHRGGGLRRLIDWLRVVLGCASGHGA